LKLSAPKEMEGTLRLKLLKEAMRKITIDIKAITDTKIPVNQIKFRILLGFPKRDLEVSFILIPFIYLIEYNK
jgi:hypothetical protein